MINYDCFHLSRIGDALCAMPYVLDQARKGPINLSVHLNPLVRALLEPVTRDLPINWNAEKTTEHEVLLDLHGVFHYCNVDKRGTHFTQGWYGLNGDPVPEVPMTLPHVSRDRTIPSNGLIVISPFSASDIGGNKLWPLERWAEAASILEQSVGRGNVVFIGASVDDFSLFQNFVCYVDRPLSSIAELILGARAFLSLDNGISHLANLSGATRHAMIYPNVLPHGFVNNPRGVFIEGKSIPADLTVDDVVNIARYVANR